MKLVTFTAHVHGGGFPRGRDGGEVGVDVVLPQPDAGEDVRRHVQGVRSRGRDLRVAAGSRQAQLGQLRLVVGMNQIVGHTGMVGLSGEEFLQNRRGSLAIRESRVVMRLGSEQ